MPARDVPSTTTAQPAASSVAACAAWLLTAGDHRGTPGACSLHCRRPCGAGVDRCRREDIGEIQRRLQQLLARPFQIGNLERVRLDDRVTFTSASRSRRAWLTERPRPAGSVAPVDTRTVLGSRSRRSANSRAPTTDARMSAYAAPPRSPRPPRVAALRRQETGSPRGRSLWGGAGRRQRTTVRGREAGAAGRHRRRSSSTTTSKGVELPATAATRAGVSPEASSGAWPRSTTRWRIATSPCGTSIETSRSAPSASASASIRSRCPSPTPRPQSAASNARRVTT